MKIQSIILGALNVICKVKGDKIPDADLSNDRFDLGKLPQDKTSKIIVYCHVK